MKLENKDHFSPTEVVLADYILENRDLILDLSIQELAKRTFTSTSAVIRLCNKVKVDGFREFKMILAQELNDKNTHQSDIDINFPFNIHDSAGEIATSIEQLTIHSLQEARSLLSITDLKKACQILIRSKNVGIFGVGDAYLAGLTFQARMTRNETNYIATPVYGEQGHLARSLKKGDCGLLLSYSGTSHETIMCGKILKQNGAHIICITANPKSELTKLSDISLLLPEKEAKFNRIASFFSSACMDYYLNVIFSYIYVLTHEDIHNLD